MHSFQIICPEAGLSIPFPVNTPRTGFGLSYITKWRQLHYKVPLLCPPLVGTRLVFQRPQCSVCWFSCERCPAWMR